MHPELFDHGLWARPLPKLVDSNARRSLSMQKRRLIADVFTDRA